jgi:hypothetical protein
MPFGPQPLGFAYFAAVKFAGYTGYAALLNRTISQTSCKIPTAWKSGLVRTGIGVAVGAVVGVGFWKLLPPGWSHEHGDALFYSGLVPVRVLEWYFFLWLLYRNCRFRLSRTVFAITGGVVTSFVLDFIGIFTVLIVPGGAWIC